MLTRRTLLQALSGIGAAIGLVKPVKAEPKPKGPPAQFLVGTAATTIKRGEAVQMRADGKWCREHVPYPIYDSGGRLVYEDGLMNCNLPNLRSDVLRDIKIV